MKDFLCYLGAIFLITFLLLIILPGGVDAAVCATDVNSVTDIGQASNNNTWNALSFTSSATCTLTDVNVWLSCYLVNGCPNVSVAIDTDAGGGPSGTAIATGTISGASIPSYSGSPPYGTTEMTAGLSAGTITSGTKYWIVLSNLYSSGTSRVLLGLYNGSGSNWYQSTNSGSTWSYGGEGGPYVVDGSTGGGGGGGSGTTSDILASTTVDIATEDMFNGFVLFFMGMWFVVYVFKKR